LCHGCSPLGALDPPLAESAPAGGGLRSSVPGGVTSPFAFWPDLLGPSSQRFRLDLWLLFFACVAFRVALAVVKTGYAAISSRASPAIVALPIPLRSEMGQLLLLWAITVTPGTIALLVEKDTVYVHWLHRPSDPQSLGLTRLVTLLERIWG